MKSRLILFYFCATCFLFACGGTHPKRSIAVTIAPATASLAPGASLQFTATVTGAGTKAVVWSATGGAITSNGTYTAGSQAGAFTVTATSAANAQRSASATITIAASAPPPPPPPPPAITVTISPATTTVAAGATAQFSAAVTGTQNTAVNWQATGGTINSSGLYTAGSQTGAFTVTATSQADAQSNATAQVTITAAAQARLFTSPGAAWLYSPPTGQAIDISSTAVKLGGISVNTVAGFGYPVEYTDGTHGCTTFTDTLIYHYSDSICVPNPPNGYWPTLGCCNGTSNDGHLIVVNTKTLEYYDFWKLYTDGNGHPTSTNVGKIVQGNLATSNGTPGTTAANITGLAGDIMPGELDCEDCLQHALNVIVPGTMNSPLLGSQGPVAISDGSVSGGIFREGAKIRFDPSVNVDSLPVSIAVKALMKALQKYGGLVTDQTGANAICIYSDLTTTPDLTGKNLIYQHLLIYY